MEEVEDGANSGWETDCKMRWRGPKAASSEGAIVTAGDSRWDTWAHLTQLNNTNATKHGGSLLASHCYRGPGVPGEIGMAAGSRRVVQWFIAPPPRPGGRQRLTGPSPSALVNDQSTRLRRLTSVRWITTILMSRRAESKGSPRHVMYLIS